MPQHKSDELHRDIQARSQELIDLRRYFHQHPETAYEEHQTAQVIAEHLRELGLEVTEGVADTGVVGLLRGYEAGRRAEEQDLEASPPERYWCAPTSTRYRCAKRRTRVRLPDSRAKCMPAATTDISPLGSYHGKMLAARRDRLRGNVKFLFQPAEERIGGAVRMIEAGVMRDPDVSAVIGLHIWSLTPVGDVVVQSGAFFASADEVHVRMQGRGGHGAMPHVNVDPVVAAAQFIMAAQTLISREISPFHPAVVTFGSIHGGTAFNVIADEVELRGTVRTYDPLDRQHILRRLGEIARDTAESLRAEAAYEVVRGCLACVNDPDHHRAGSPGGRGDCGCRPHSGRRSATVSQR